MPVGQTFLRVVCRVQRDSVFGTSVKLMPSIRVSLPHHLRTLANVGTEVRLEIQGAVTQRSVLDALETRYPMLQGTIRDYATRERRPLLRFFACEMDLSYESPDA